MHSFNPADGLLFFPYLLLLNVTTAEKPDRQASFTHTTDVYTEPEKDMNGTIKTAFIKFLPPQFYQLFKQMATLFYFSLLNINNTDGLFIPRIINTFAALIKKAMKFDIKNIFI